MSTSKVRSCPRCGKSDAIVPILYGLPAGEAMEEAERGEIALGGCMVGDIDPNYRCGRCLISFDFTRPELASPEEAVLGWIEESATRQ